VRGGQPAALAARVVRQGERLVTYLQNLLNLE
jgi:hypothetical protein